jgi:hypothetical protein
MDKYIRRQNVERYRRLLKIATNKNRRKELLRLLSEAKQAQ